MERQKKVLAIADLCVVGKVSLNVIMPILSAMEIETCPMPTVLLSIHTDGYGEPYTKDLTETCVPVIKHLNKLNICFDGIYCGYMANKNQVSIIRELIESESAKIKLIDPVMGDNGKYYMFFDDEYLKEIQKLIKTGDIITPNLTEAFLLLNENYKEGCISDNTIKIFLKKLSNMGPKYIIITSIIFEDGTYGNVAYDSNENKFFKINFHYYPVTYPGTGDIFSSVVLGCMVKDEDIRNALGVATYFCESAVKATYNRGTPLREGIYLESELCTLNQKTKLNLVQEF